MQYDRAKRRALVELLAPPTVGTVRAVCPACDGGTSHETTFVVTRHQSGDVSGYCFRASCEFSVGARAADPAKAPKAPRFYTRPTIYPTIQHAELLQARFGLEPGTVTQYSPHEDRFILDVRGPSGRRRGVLAYSLSGRQPKSLTYNERPDEPFIHWTGNLCPVVIVEDWFSAEKVAAAGGLGVALMGTHISRDMVAEIAAAKAPTVIALDQDAFAKGLKYRARYAEQFPAGLRAWRLVRDLKYETVERIQRAFRGEEDFNDYERKTSDRGNIEITECT